MFPLALGLVAVSPVVRSSDSGAAVQETVAASTCVPRQADVVPSSREWIRVSRSRAVTVRKGMFVGLEVVEPDAYTATPGFPWAKPLVSTGGVVAPARKCSSSPEVSTLPAAEYYFRAVKPGSAVVTIPLTVSWLHHKYNGCQAGVYCAPLSDLRVAITVKPR